MLDVLSNPEVKIAEKIIGNMKYVWVSRLEYALSDEASWAESFLVMDMDNVSAGYVEVGHGYYSVEDMETENQGYINVAFGIDDKWTRRNNQRFDADISGDVFEFKLEVLESLFHPLGFTLWDTQIVSAREFEDEDEGDEEESIEEVPHYISAFFYGKRGFLPDDEAARERFIDDFVAPCVLAEEKAVIDNPEEKFTESYLSALGDFRFTLRESPYDPS